ncbi:GGDEF domain-containing protein [Psychromonas sp. KJ10-2]|uniref:GGDEF domain-containing protein n=1 Tax=Psychromonas sp. KJ10-2 TaxID=3391822 RepID=UPI0039B3BA66
MESIPNKEYSYNGTKSPIFTVFSNEPLLSTKDKLFTLETLQKSLDLKEIMENFASLVASFIRPFNIRFQSAFGFFSLSKSLPSNFTRNFNLDSADHSPRLGTMTYQSETPITATEDKLLAELHQLLQPTLKHALRFSELSSMVYKDHLTNIGNRAYYEETIFHAIEQSNRTNLGLSLMVLDINKFKPINDTYGHTKGDQVLNAFAQVLTKSIRTSDFVFRLGGDEFVVILQPSASCSVSKVQQRILQEIDKNSLLKELDFSASYGFSHWEIGTTASQLFDQADQHLYQNKALDRAQR